MPGVAIHYLTKKAFEPVLRANPNIDKIHTLDKSLGLVIKKLKAEDFDYVADLHRNFRSRIVKTRLHKPHGTFSKLNRSKWLLVNARINMLPDVHIVERYFNAVKHLGVTPDGEGLDYFIPENENISISREFPPDFHGHYLLAVVGGKHKTKQIPVDKMAAICNKTNYPVILAGGKEDYKQAEEVVAKLKVPVLNSCGKFNINQSADLVKKAAVVLSPDTGLMHIAAAFRKPLVTLWGNTIPEFGMYPYMPGSDNRKFRIHEIKELYCRPCSKIGFERCPKGHFRCMNEIPVDEVVRSVKEVTES